MAKYWYMTYKRANKDLGPKEGQSFPSEVVEQGSLETVTFKLSLEQSV